METNWKWVDHQDWKWDLVDIFHPNAPVGTPADQFYGGALHKTNDNYDYYLYDQSLTAKNRFICRRGDGSPLADRWEVAHSLWRDRSTDCRCTTWGDPHYTSFDGMQHDYQGNCTYIHVIDKKHNPSLFTINVKTQFPYHGAPVSMVYRVVVKAHNYKITLNRGKVVWVDDYPVTLPHSPFGGLHIMNSGRYVLLLSSYGFWVKFDGQYRLVIGVSRGYEGLTAGACGICDGEVANDDLKPNSRHARDSNGLFNSWNIDGSCASVTNVEEQCPGGNVDNYNGNSKCGMIKNRNGIFADCHDVIDPEFPYQSCIYDMCHGTNKQERDEALCYSLENYFDMCREAGIHLDSFRSDSFCPVTCPSHSHYSACMSPCPATCATAGDCAYNPDQCVEGCECDLNYVMAGSRCVHKTNCGCVDDFGDFHANDEVWLSPDCRRECTCSDMNYIRCKTLPACQENAGCLAVNGVRSCQCIPGYKEDADGECIAVDMCESTDLEFEGNCYKIVNEPASSFDNAEELCEHKGYQLASIMAETEYSFLRQTLTLPEYGREAYWVAASGRDGSENGVVQTTWRWTTGDLWTWKLEEMFTTGAPDNLNGNEFCGMLEKESHYYMNDEACGKEYGFICKKSGGPVYERWVQQHTLWANTENYCKCFVFGDPHYKTFDGRKIHFQGTCTYTLLMDWAHITQPWFIVNAKNTLPYEGADVSLVRFVIIRAHDLRIILKRLKEVTVNDVLVTLPHNPHPGVSIMRSGLYVMVLTDLGFWVQYDGMYKVKVGLDHSYGRLARGMCGLCDGEQANDYLRPDGTLAVSDVDFGDSWLVEESCGPGERDVTDEEPICPTNNAQEYNTEELCGRISDPLGHFASCHSVEPPQFYVESCIYDMCHALDSDERDRVLCYSLGAYLEACRDAGVQLPSFRTDFFCPYPCPPLSSFNGCMSPCQPTCMSPNECEYSRCVEGCQCHDGYVLIGNQCVPKSDCGCVDSDGNLHERDEKWISSDCKRLCKCLGLDKIRCSHRPGCQANSHCAGEAGRFSCQCDEGFTLDDKGQCVEITVEEYDCREQCGGTCRHQTCQGGEMKALDSCRCRGTILNTCCIDNPHELTCEQRGGECRSDCQSGESECTTDCNCYDTGSKCCVPSDELPVLQCESSPCSGLCRATCRLDEVVSRAGCKCSGDRQCCIPNPRILSCNAHCGGECLDECRLEKGWRPMESKCVCGEVGKVCCKKFAYMIGDPHVSSLAGRDLSTQELCSFILLQDCVNSPKDFRIVATTKERIYITKEASNVDSVIIYAKDKKVQLFEKTAVKVDDELVALPIEPDEGMSISEITYDRDGIHFKVRVSLVGLNILWDGKNAVTVDLIGDLRGKVCGLFGDGRNSKDLIKPDGTVATTNEEFVNSWVVDGSCRERETKVVEY
ncbi:zonadhesin-like isoform X2 [Ptychodera flava]